MGANLTLFHKGLVLVSIPLLFELAFIVLVSNMQDEQRVAQQLAFHSKEVLNHAEVLQGNLLDAHTAWRAYVLTGDSAFKEPYQHAGRDIPLAAATLKKLVSDDAEQSPRAARIAELSTKYFAWLLDNETMVQEGRRKDALVRLKSGEGEQQLDALRKTLTALRDEEERLQSARTLALERAQRFQRALLWFGSAGTLGITLLLAFLFRRGITARLDTVMANAERFAGGAPLASPLAGHDEIAALDRAFHDMARQIARSEQDIREQTQIWRAVLNSMGDGVMVADEHGTLLVFNPAAERIIGLAATSAAPEEWPESYGVFEPDTVTPLQSESQPLARALRGENSDGVELFVRNPRLASGVWIQATGRPLCLDGKMRGGVVVFRDISERKRDEQAIRQLAEDLEQRVAARTAELAAVNRDLAHKNQENELFVYSVSHDLRSPLVNLEGFSKELAGACQSLRRLVLADGVPPQIRDDVTALVEGGMCESVHFIQSAVHRLSTIIDALLRLSRAGRVEYVWQRVDVAGLVNRVVESLHNTVAQRGATVSIGELPEAWGDPFALEQVFANLIGNALNYLDPKRPGVIDIRGSREDGSVAFVVRDNGIGIPDHCRAKVFGAFQRLHPELAPGEGIGLAIVRRIVERHHGRVWVESQVNVGTAFHVSLPSKPEEG